MTTMIIVITAKTSLLTTFFRSNHDDPSVIVDQLHSTYDNNCNVGSIWNGKNLGCKCNRSERDGTLAIEMKDVVVRISFPKYDSCNLCGLRITLLIYSWHYVATIHMC